MIFDAKRAYPTPPVARGVRLKMEKVAVIPLFCNATYVHVKLKPLQYQRLAALEKILARLDLPIRVGEEAGVVVEAAVGMMDHDWHLVRVDFQGGYLWTMDTGVEVGHKDRVRVLARDVSLAGDP